MNWGTKIALLYAGFVVLIVTLVSLSMRENVDLVSADYYAQELNHQNKIDKIQRTQKLNESVTWTTQKESIHIHYPVEFQGQLSGIVKFFRPSDASLDTSFKIAIDTAGMQSISTKDFKKGVYSIQINWLADTTQYYNEGTIQLQ